MAKEIYGFFDPTESDDRQYSADEFAAAFRARGGTGAGNGLTVSPAGGRMVAVSPGGAMIHGYFYNLVDDGGDPMTFALGVSGGADRYDRVILRLDLSANARELSLMVREGTPGASPVPPALVQTDVVKEISLCKIRVRASTSAIAATDIEDERGDTSACGWLAVDALQYDALDQRYSNTLLANDLTTTAAGYALDARQGKSLNDAVSLKLAKADVTNNLTTTAGGYALDARQGKTLNDEVVANKLTDVTATLSSTTTTTSGTVGAWYGTAAPYTQVVSVSGMTSATQAIVKPSPSITAAQMNAAVDAILHVTAQSAGKITVSAFGDRPAVAIPILIRKNGR